MGRPTGPVESNRISKPRPKRGTPEPGEERKEKQGDPLIGVLGLLGTKYAKAPLLHELSEASAIKRTDDVEGVKVHMLSFDDGSRITLIDIPAFEDTSLKSNAVIICQSMFRFFQTQASVEYNALVFAHDISSREERRDLLNFGLVKDLCGEHFYGNVAIFTTNWNEGPPSESFETRESEIHTRPDYCSELFKDGAQLHRCWPNASNSTLLSVMASHQPMALGIQIEVEGRLRISQTALGATLRTRLRESIQGTHKRAQDLKRELVDASIIGGEALPNDDLETIREVLQIVQREEEMLEDILRRIEETTEDSSIRQEIIQPFLCLMGTNSAKSMILRAATAGVDKRTMEIQDGVEVYTIQLDDTLAVSIASLPAFENDDVEMNLAVCETLFNFFYHLETRECNAMIMAHDISMLRLRRCDLLNFHLVADLCGPQFFTINLAILTTNWHSETAAETAHLVSRESDLRSREDCFLDFLKHGAQCLRHEYEGSPPTLELLRAFAAQPAMPLAIQGEVSTTANFSRTKLGVAMAQQLRDHLKMVSERHDSWKVELAEALKGNWGLLEDDEKRAMEREQDALEQTQVWLSRILKDYFS